MTASTAGQTTPTVSTTDASRWNLLQRRVQENRTIEAVRLLRSHGIDPIVIKGVAAARYYPHSEPRPSVDVDLAVCTDQFAAARDLCESPEANGIPIDLHRELRHLDTVAWDDLFRNAVDLTFSEGSVKALRPEDDLRVLCVHWLTDGGVYEQRLWDIYYGIVGRDADFDWDRFIKTVSPRRQRWIECTLGLAAKYLDLDLTGTPLEGAQDRLPAWMVKTVEKEWAAEIKPLPLEASLYDRTMLFAQLKRRMRPNPIFATIDCEGSLDASTRIFYQIRNGIGRIPSSLRRIKGTLQARHQWKVDK